MLPNGGRQRNSVHGKGLVFTCLRRFHLGALTHALARVRPIDKRFIEEYTS
jgi:hypothetical protein